MIHREAWYKVGGDPVVYKDDKVTLKKTPKGRVYMDSPGGAVAVLPFRKDSNKPFLILEEPVEILGSGLYTGPVFGGIRDHGSPDAAALGELEEEAGISASKDALIPLGEVWFTKSIKGKVSLYAVDVTGLSVEEAEGDGSWEEEKTRIRWVDRDALLASESGILSALLARLDGALESDE